MKSRAARPTTKETSSPRKDADDRWAVALASRGCGDWDLFMGSLSRLSRISLAHAPGRFPFLASDPILHLPWLQQPPRSEYLSARARLTTSRACLCDWTMGLVPSAARDRDRLTSGITGRRKGVVGFGFRHLPRKGTDPRLWPQGLPSAAPTLSAVGDQASRSTVARRDWKRRGRS
jgi:hypothetical protein